MLGPQYCVQFGRVEVDSLKRQQDYSAMAGQVKSKIEVDSLVDTTIVEEAIKTLVVRFQHSHRISARTFANVGIKRPLASLCF
jgi:hypothetical protein